VIIPGDAPAFPDFADFADFLLQLLAAFLQLALTLLECSPFSFQSFELCQASLHR